MTQEIVGAVSLRVAVESGAVPMERIDDAVRRILRAKFELGLFEQPHGDERLLAEVGADEHRAVAREAVARKCTRSFQSVDR